MIIAKDYHIEMLSVGAADAFILYVIDNQDKGHLILIDAGNYNDGDKIIKHIRKYYSNPVIDLAIVTHCDDDHYGGFVRMLEKLKKESVMRLVLANFGLMTLVKITFMLMMSNISTINRW